MQTPLTSGIFWQQLAKSGLLSPERTASVAREFKKRSIGTDEEASVFLVKRGLLTQYQADRLMEGRSPRVLLRQVSPAWIYCAAGWAGSIGRRKKEPRKSSP